MPNCNTVVISLTYASSHFLVEEAYNVILWICSDIYLLYSLVLSVSSIATNGKLYMLLYAAVKLVLLQVKLLFLKFGSLTFQ